MSTNDCRYRCPHWTDAILADRRTAKEVVLDMLILGVVVLLPAVALSVLAIWLVGWLIGIIL